VIADPWFYAAAIPAILLMGISKGGFGIGAGIFATPILALTMPIPQAAAILLPILCAMDVVGLWAYRGKYSRDNLLLMLAGGVAGIGLGTLAFSLLNDAWIRLGTGLMAVAFVLHRVGGSANTRPAPFSRAKGLFWSTVSGMTSMIAHAGGPPLSVYLLPLRLDKALMVGTTIVFFAVINYAKLVPYTWLGLFDARNLMASLALAPLVPVGILLGIALQRRLSERLFYRVCYGGLLVVGVKLAWDGVRTL
jgi:uncharacterized protein